MASCSREVDHRTDNESDEEDDPRNIQSSDGNEHEKVTFLKRSMSGFLSRVTTLRKGVMELMRKSCDIDLVKGQLNLLDVAFDRYSNAFQIYYEKIIDPIEREHVNKQFDMQFSVKLELDISVGDWIQSIRNLSNNNSNNNPDINAKLQTPMDFDNFQLHESNVRNSGIDFLTPKGKHRVFDFDLNKTRSFPAKDLKVNIVTTEPSQPLQPVNSAAAPPDVLLSGFERLFIQQQKTMEMLANSLNSISNSKNTDDDLPKPEILTFNGDPLNYWKFMNNFDDNVHNTNRSDKTKLRYLIQFCEGEARSNIEDCVVMPPSAGYVEARRILQKQYGRPHVIARSYIDALVNGPSIKTNDRQSLLKLASAMNRCYLTVNSMGYEADINNFDNLSYIVLRLPLTLQFKWASVAEGFYDVGKEPTFKNLADFVSNCASINTNAFGQIIGSKPKCENATPVVKSKQFGNNSYRATTMFTAAREGRQPVTFADRTGAKCLKCNDNHLLEECTQFNSLSISDRISFCRFNRLCDNCLFQGHVSRGCLKPRNCNIPNCTRKHHPLLHTSSSNYYASTSQTNGNPNSIRQCNAIKAGSNVRLKIVPVKVTSNGKVLQTYALLDSGADVSLCHSNVTRSLGIMGNDVQLSLVTINGNIKRSAKLIDADVHSIDGKCSIHIPQLVSVDSLPISSDSIPCNDDCERFPHLCDVKLPVIHSPKCVQLLIGADVPDAHWNLEDRKGQANEPFAVRTPLGWTLMGPFPSSCDKSCDFNVNFISNEVKAVEQIRSLWLTEFNETHNCSKTHSKEDNVALSIMKNSVELKNGHYELSLPWRSKQHVPNNRWLAESRLNSLKHRFLQDPDLFDKYCSVINDYISNNYAEVIPPNQVNSKITWYLPHHPVLNPHKPDKVRVVYDCSAKYKDISLNSMLLQGPDLTNNLVGTLTRFREHPVAFVADIEAMFHQVRVKGDDVDMLRFLWWPNNDLSKKAVDHRMLVHIFGATSSPSCASFALRKTAEDNNTFNPQVQYTVKRNFYVDDCLKSCSNISSAKNLSIELSKLLAKGGFNLNKYACNIPSVLDRLPKSKWAEIKTFSIKGDRLMNTLGIQWNISQDIFQFNVHVQSKPATRRGILSVISGIYDPLGFVAPFILPAKQILQSLCLQKFDWDADIPVEHRNRWSSWLEDLPSIEQICIPRSFCSLDVDVVDFQLHHFCDASSTGYGAVVYLRTLDIRGEVKCHFVIGKSRLHPKTATTIPRMELTSAVTSAKLQQFLELELDLKLNSITFWTDSTTVLAYINNTNKHFKPFVANRLSIISDVSMPSQWRYVPSKLNPADIASRGIQANKLHSNCNWLIGPSFLYDSVENWPQNITFKTANLPNDELFIEKRKNAYAISESNPMDKLLNHFSSLKRLLKASIWLTRFKSYLLKQKFNAGPVSVNELETAQMDLIKYVQGSNFKFNGGMFPLNIRKLNPILNKGVIRVGGRLNIAPFDFDSRHPIILPQHSQLTDLIIDKHHNDVGHAGAGHTWAETRKRFWVVKGGTAVRHVLSKCILCRRRNATLGYQFMSDFPLSRLNVHRPPFYSTGVDYFGPLLVKERRSVLKRYGCLFTCMTTRAIHVEISHSLSTDSFICALKRFVSRRGTPRFMHSDNGTNFVGANKEIINSLSAFNHDKINTFCSDKGFDWIFNPPFASHMGGAWERLIRSVRRILNCILGSQLVTDETLLTVMAEVECIVNSRPLTPLTADAKDANPLTPSHLLNVQRHVSLTDEIVSKPDTFRKHWKQAQYISQLFWKRFQSEYLSFLQIRQKWFNKKKNISIGDVVLVCDPSVTRGNWPLGLIINVFPDSKGVVRTVEVKIKDKVYTRPITKVALLESCEDE